MRPGLLKQIEAALSGCRTDLLTRLSLWLLARNPRIARSCRKKGNNEPNSGTLAQYSEGSTTAPDDMPTYSCGKIWALGNAVSISSPDDPRRLCIQRSYHGAHACPCFAAAGPSSTAGPAYVGVIATQELGFSELYALSTTASLDAVASWARTIGHHRLALLPLGRCWLRPS
jgi:hypothetical protein